MEDLVWGSLNYVVILFNILTKSGFLSRYFQLWASLGLIPVVFPDIMRSQVVVILKRPQSVFSVLGFLWL